MFTSKYFNMGQVVVTQTINNAMMEDSIFSVEIIFALHNFSNKEWGALSEEDKLINEDALQYPDDLYLLGAYETTRGKIFIITNRASEKAGDNVTTVLFPNER